MDISLLEQRISLITSSVLGKYPLEQSNSFKNRINECIARVDNIESKVPNIRICRDIGLIN